MSALFEPDDTIDRDAPWTHMDACCDAKYTAQPARLSTIEPNGRPAAASETLHSSQFDFVAPSWGVGAP